MRCLPRVIPGFVACVALTACGGEGGLVVELATDLPLPAADTTLTLEIIQGGSPVFVRTFRLDRTADEGGLELPATIVLRDDPNAAPRKGTIPPGTLALPGTGAVDVIASVSRGGAPLVDRAARVPMPSAEVKRLRMTLESECIGVPCGDGQTCQAATCVGFEVDPASLPND